MNKVEHYPVFEYGVVGPAYYVQFYGDTTYTLFRRNIINPHQKFEYDSTAFERFANEGHPYKIFDSSYERDGCIPDKKWVKFMVDQLNKG